VRVYITFLSWFLQYCLIIETVRLMIFDLLFDTVSHYDYICFIIILIKALFHY